MKKGETNEGVDRGYLFERLFLDEVLAIMDELKLSRSAVAERAFPKAGEAKRRLRHIIMAEEKKSPQRITLQDAFNLAEGIGVPLRTLVMTAVGRVREESSRGTRGG